jgi:hypothetical protein
MSNMFKKALSLFVEFEPEETKPASSSWSDDVILIPVVLLILLSVRMILINLKSILRSCLIKQIYPALIIMNSGK